MDRSEAISEVLGYISRIEGEWGSGSDTTEEAVEVLSALGVTRDELIGHNVIKAGFFYEMFLKVAGLAGLAADSEALLASIRREIAVTLDYRDPREKDLRAKLFELAPAPSPFFTTAKE